MTIADDIKNSSLVAILERFEIRLTLSKPLPSSFKRGMEVDLLPDPTSAPTKIVGISRDRKRVLLRVGK